MEHRWWHWSRIRIVERRRSSGSQILSRERSTSWQLFCHVTQITMVNVDVKGWHDNDNGSCNGNDNEKSDRVGSTRRREPIRVRGLGCCRAPIVRSKTVVWGTFHIHCPPAQTAIVAIIIVFVIDTQYIKRFEETSVLYLLGLHARLKIGTFKMYLSLLLLHDSGCMFSSLSWEQKFWGAQLRLKMKMIAIVAQIKITTRRPQWKFEVQFCPPHIIYHSPSLRLQVGPCITCSTCKSQTTLSS